MPEIIITFHNNSTQTFTSFNDIINYDDVKDMTVSIQYFPEKEKKIKTLPTLPKNLQKLEVWDIGLKRLPPLPQTLLVLDCGQNNLKELPPLPPGIKVLNCSWNRLKQLPPLPFGLEELDYTWNQFIDDSIIDIPSSLKTLYIMEIDKTKSYHSGLEIYEIIDEHGRT